MEAGKFIKATLIGIACIIAYYVIFGSTQIKTDFRGAVSAFALGVSLLYGYPYVRDFFNSFGSIIFSM